MPSNRLNSILIIFIVSSAVGVPFGSTSAQQRSQLFPPTKVMIDADILTALTDEPCRHFEAAQEQMSGGHYNKAAAHLRIATAYLRLESARADHEQQRALGASVRELLAIARRVELGERLEVGAFRQAIARSHYALAAHHCANSARRCCETNANNDQRQLTHAAYDLRAAVANLQQAAKWERTQFDVQSQQFLRDTKLTVSRLIQHGGGGTSQNDLRQLIRKTHAKLESLTGRRILLAQPLTAEQDRMGPSLYR